MQNSFFYIVASIFITGITGCKKDTYSIDNLSSVRIVNTISGGTTAIVNNLGPIYNNFYWNYSFNAGTPNIYIYPEADSLHPYFVSNKLELKEKGVYSLFLGGTQGAIESIFVEESLASITDSVAAIRFVNLSPGAPAVNVTLSTSTGINEFSNVEYKGITDFKHFPAKMEDNFYEFQVWDVNNPSEPLATIVIENSFPIEFSMPRFRYVTLVLSGNVDGIPASITRVNHYKGFDF